MNSLRKKIRESLYSLLHEAISLDDFYIDDLYNLYRGEKRLYSPDNKKDLIKFLEKNIPELIAHLGLRGENSNKNNEKIISPKLLSTQIFTQPEMVKMGANYHLQHGMLMMIPVDQIEGLDPTPGSWTDDEGHEKKFQPGVDLSNAKPIETHYDAGQDAFLLYDGNHRITQAKVNGDQYIKGFVQADKHQYNIWKNKLNESTQPISDHPIISAIINHKHGVDLTPHDVSFVQCETSKPNACETNVFNYIYERPEEDLYPVKGYAFERNFPIEHWWVYDKSHHYHLDPTPGAENFTRYVGIIGFGEKVDTKNPFDSDFFRSGNIKKYLTENSSSKKVWYHGSADGRSLKQGFEQRSTKVTYISDPEKLRQLQDEMKKSRAEGNNDAYWKALNQVDDCMTYVTMKMPLFFTDKESVARTYAYDKKAFDYQNSEPGIFEFHIDEGRNANIFAPGRRFRHIEIDLVKKGFIDSGASPEDVDLAFERLNHPDNLRNKVTNTTIGLIAQELGFDSVDVIGVLDSYHGGSLRSTVRIVWDANRIKKVEKLQESIENQHKNVGKSLGVSIESILDKLDPNSSFDDIYPGFQDPEDLMNQSDPSLLDYYFESEEEAYKEVAHVIRMFEKMPDPIPVWRTVKVDNQFDIRLKSPGESWSYTKQGAINFAKNHGLGNVLLHAKCPKELVDWEKTILLYFEFTCNGFWDGSAEEEIYIERDWELKDIRWKWIK